MKNTQEKNIQKNVLVKDVKDTLIGEQNMLASAFRLEAFYRKYRVLIFIFVAIVVVILGFWGVSSYLDSYHKEKMGEILEQLSNKDLDEGKKAQLLAELESKDSVLYDFYMYDNLHNLSILQLQEKENLDVLKKLMQSKDPLISTLSTYQYAVINDNLEMLEKLIEKLGGSLDSKDSNAFGMLKDKARFLAAYLYLQKNEILKARDLLSNIKENSQMYDVAMLLKHYGVTLESALKPTLESKDKTGSKDSQNAQDSNKTKDSEKSQAKNLKAQNSQDSGK